MTADTLTRPTAHTMPMRRMELFTDGREKRLRLLHEGPDFRPYVQRGAALLDERVPGWADAVDVDVLQLENSRSCVVGQLAIRAMLNGPLDGYYQGIDKLFGDVLPYSNREVAAGEHGFNLSGTYYNWFERARGYGAGRSDYPFLFDRGWAFEELTRFWTAEIKRRRSSREQSA